MEVDEEVPNTERSGENDERQIVNSIDGFVWKVDDMKRLHRFLVLGSESPTYYMEERKLATESGRAIVNLLQQGRGVEVVDEIRKYSIEGRTVKQNPIMFALALCARRDDLATKRRAYEVLPEVCRIPTHLFMFIDYCKILSKQNGEKTKGWGRAHRNAIKKWYISNCNSDPMKLAKNITKYQKREGWSHRDVARLMHLKPEGQDVRDELRVIMRYVVQGWDQVLTTYFPADRNVPHMSIGEGTNAVLEFLRAVEDVKRIAVENEALVIELIRQYNLVREHIPTLFLNSVEVWRALLTKMPMMAMIRNLGKMTSVGLLSESEREPIDRVCSKLRDVGMLKSARIHPFNVLVALKTYMDGHGDKGRLRWNPNEEILTALEKAFYLSFKNVESTDKRHLLAIDVSGSMSYVGCAGTPCITPRVASAAMSMVTAKTESNHNFVAFSDQIVPLMIDKDMSLDEVLAVMKLIPMGGTDCALPMLYAIENKLEVDVFVVYTDCETRTVSMQPSEALKKYRERSGIRDAKLIVVAMTSNGFTIADPDDPGMFDMAGFDSAAPKVMREFILGSI